MVLVFKIEPESLKKNNNWANDVVLYETCSHYLVRLWAGPLLLLASIAIMFFYLGPCAFTIIAILVILIPIQRTIY